MKEINYFFGNKEIPETPTICFGVTDSNIYFIINNEENDINGCFFPEPPTAHMTFEQILKLFPESIEYFQSRLTDEKSVLNKLMSIKKEMLKKKDPFFVEREMSHDINKQKTIIDNLNTIIGYLSTPKISGKFNNGVKITKELIQKVKQIPISNFIEFNKGGFAKSIWNPHEKTPSMKYYKNNNMVKCFSSNNMGDVIDVIKQTHRLDFIKAVEYLSNYI